MNSPFFWELARNIKVISAPKKDVIDSEGRSYSVKSGEKKWQIFLYGKKRFGEDYTFKGMLASVRPKRFFRLPNTVSARTLYPLPEL